MALARETIEVWADWDGTDLARIGSIHATPSRGRLLLAFEYDRAWLATAPVTIDPGLAPVPGDQFPGAGRDNFGVFLDSAPDRWGRVLMQRREALVARRSRRAVRRLSEVDYLLGVFDGHRMGGLRYKRADGPFLDDDAALASPPWTSLRELEQASLHLERDGAEADRRYGEWLRMLIAPGRSLGGARPKASVLDPDGALWLAKFPSANDRGDVGGWEGVVHALAARAGIEVAEAKHRKFGSSHHTFLTRRFDRTSTGRRIHFASAMTLLDRRDGEIGASYLDLADLIAREGAFPTRDLEQLWRRIVFFVCVSNVDDHLRNHGFLLSAKGWSLAPAYDMNPNPDGGGLVLNISETSNALDLELVLEVAPSFRIKARRAKEVVSQVRTVVRTWRAAARNMKLSRAEQDAMANAFSVA